MRLANVDQGQHHENEALEQHDQNVEDRPDCPSQHVAQEGKRTTQGQRSSATQQSDQHEYQFACVHVAEQSHAQGHGLRSKFNEVQHKVGDPKQWV